MAVVVIGGGIIGVACGYYLAERGIDVTVCEQASLGHGSTERSLGGIRTQFSTRVNVELSLASLAVWDTFTEQFGIDIEFRKVGYLFLARTPETADAFRQQVTMQQNLGVPSEYLTPAAAREKCPGLQTAAFQGATFAPTDGFADPHLALQGFAGALRQAGGKIRTNTAVTGIETTDGEVAGVTVDGESLSVDYVVNAAGPWARRVGQLAGIDLPIAPKRRQVLVVDPSEGVPESVPLTIDLDRGVYFRPERDGIAFIGGHFGDADPDADPDGYRDSFDLDWATEALDRASAVAEYFGPESQIRRGWAGLYAVTPDHHPIVEETIPGYITAAGFSGHGFQHAPATGKLVAELVDAGSASLVNVDRLGSDRFSDGDLIKERNVA